MVNFSIYLNRHVILRKMLINIYMKFREDSLNGFQVIEKTLFGDTDRQCSKGKNSKSVNARVMFLALCTLFDVY